MRRSKGVAFTGLIEAQGAPVFLLNCRVIRGLPQTGGDMLIKAGRLIPFEDANQPSPPLIVLTAGSVCSIRNCVVAGVHGTAVSLLGGNAAPARIEIENSLFAIQRGFLLRTQPGFRAELQASGNVFVCQ